MANVTVIGAQWGDEGKGKIVDMLAEAADIVVRFQGGHNAGHTLVINDKTFKLSLLPSGVVRPDILNVIGSGVVISPQKLVEEMAELRASGVTLSDGQIIIAENASILLPLHAYVDGVLESSGEGPKIGTTRRGISQAYQDRVGRRALRVVDLKDDAAIRQKGETMLSHWNPILESHGAEPYRLDTLLEEAKAGREDILGMARPNVPHILENAIRADRNILFEGAQGTLLDIDHGTYPYVTSSNTIAAAVGTGVGLGPRTSGHVLGILKAYTTRVGKGPFPTAMEGEEAERVGAIGREFGTVTGRSRDCGWLDLVAMKKAVRLNGIDSLALTKIDVMDRMPVIRAAIAYHLDGTEIDYFPNCAEELARVTPVYRDFEGWISDTRGARRYDDLPGNARAYMGFIEDYLGIPIDMVSVGPERSSIIERRKLFGR